MERRRVCSLGAGILLLLALAAGGAVGAVPRRHLAFGGIVGPQRPDDAGDDVSPPPPEPASPPPPSGPEPAPPPPPASDDDEDGPPPPPPFPVPEPPPPPPFPAPEPPPAPPASDDDDDGPLVYTNYTISIVGGDADWRQVREVSNLVLLGNPAFAYAYGTGEEEQGGMDAIYYSKDERGTTPVLREMTTDFDTSSTGAAFAVREPRREWPRDRGATSARPSAPPLTAPPPRCPAHPVGRRRRTTQI